MSEIDISSILAALAAIERQPNNRAIKSLLLTKGFPASVAQPVSFNELCYWQEDEVHLVLDRLHASISDIQNPKLKSFEVQLSPSEIRAGKGATDFVKPTKELVDHSAEVLGALCVNAAGEFAVNPKEGYIALSHVWVQGLGGDPAGRGLHRSLVRQVFELMQRGGLKEKWIWTDSLAIPGGGEELRVADEEIKGQLINAMAGIYKNAKGVVVLDALVLRLNSVAAVDTAVILSLGKWLTRVWTYQEIKLATNAMVATKTGFVSFAAMVDELLAKAFDEVGDGYDTSKMGQFPSLYKTFARLQRNDSQGVSLSDIAIGCGYREAMDKLDYARSVFPTLGLEWQFGDGLEEAMRKIYEAQKTHATKLVLYHGPPRAAYPGWAPAVFPGLVDSKVITPGIWKGRGMERNWLTTKIRSIVPSKPGATILELDNGTGQSPGAYSLVYISAATEKDSPQSVALFKEAVSNGTAYLLTDEPLIPKQPFCRVGIVVERFTKPKPTQNEAWVIMTVAIAETEPEYHSSREDWLLLHENPTANQQGTLPSSTGKDVSDLNFDLIHSINPNPPDNDHHLADYPLHKAAASGDIATIHAITSGHGYIDINQQDPRGWTPLHYASAAGHPAAVSTLASIYGASPTIATRNYETPLVLAIDNNHLDATMELFEAGAEVDFFHPKGFSPLTTACRRDNMEMVRLCLMMGADPNKEDGYSSTPLCCAVKDDDRIGENGGILKELIDAGAVVDQMVKSGASALFLAVKFGYAGAVKMLLANGGDPNGVNKAIACLAQYAIEERQVGILEALLEAGAKVDGQGDKERVWFSDGWTAMMVAASVGDVPVGRLLRAYGADMFASGGSDGWTPLHVAASKGEKLFFKWLVEEGGEGRVWEKDRFGKTGFDLRSWV